MLACQVFGHRYRFRAEDRTLCWDCARCGAAGGTRKYPTADQARRYAAAFDREDSEDLGRRAPLLGMFPLRIGRWLMRRTRGN